MLSPKEFIEKWQGSALKETQSYQTHFDELCEMLGVPKPSDVDPEGTFFCFQQHVEKATQGRGFADVWHKGRFAWEYKGKHKDLDEAYHQLLNYHGGLNNPPLLVVCDYNNYRIYPKFPGYETRPITFTNQDLVHPRYQRYLRNVLTRPDAFLEELRKRDEITEELSQQFAQMAHILRERLGYEPVRVARFLAKLTFCLFAEDVGLLPPMEVEGAKTGLLSWLIEHARPDPEQLALTRLTEREFATALGKQISELFRAMRDGGYMVVMPVVWFNGGLFEDTIPGSDDGVEALHIAYDEEAYQILRKVAQADWRSVNPSIFGTLFERALDERKRAQLGAQYTGEDDIRLIVEPVLMAPLRRAWNARRETCAPLFEVLRNTASSMREQQAARLSLEQHYDDMMERLGSVRVLDPACGSGNFLYVSLSLLKDLEQEVRDYFAPLGLPYRETVTPRQLYGIEKDEFAARLARIVVWIGYLQWRYHNEGYLIYYTRMPSHPDPRALPLPIIHDLNGGERIRHADAILQSAYDSQADRWSIVYNEQGQPVEPEWPEVDVIVSNPPFLGDKRMRTEMGDPYVDTLRSLYADRIPGQSDLVCYWFEKARAHLEQGKVKRVGMLATNSIRGGVNRAVLERIKQTGNIFWAWSDRPWLLDGAAVRISMVAFDNNSEKEYVLDGVPVTYINADLQNTIDATKARRLAENAGIAFQGPVKVGAFDISKDQALSLLNAINQSGLNNAQVVRPWMNGDDIVHRSREMWIIDFGDMELEQAEKFEQPLEYIRQHVKPERDKNRRARRREKWWQHGETVPGLRAALNKLSRYIGTPRVAKHRLFQWFDRSILPDTQIVVFARADDYFFGVLHSKPHELWSLRLCTWLGKGNDPRYTPTTTFETYPFPWTPGQEPTADPRHTAIADAARQLHAERDAWLNPPELVGPEAGLGDAEQLKKRTLTALYNALVEYRAGTLADKSPAAEFAPRLAELHDALDRSVAAAYRWEPDVLANEEEMLRRLLALNLERAGG